MNIIDLPIELDPFIDNEDKNASSKYGLVQMLRLCQFRSNESGSNRIIQVYPFSLKTESGVAIGVQKGGQNQEITLSYKRGV